MNVYLYYKKTVRILTHCEYLANSDDLFAKLSILKLKDNIAYKSYVFGFKAYLFICYCDMSYMLCNINRLD